MRDKKTVFIIPGFRHKPTNKAYTELAKILKSEGYLPIHITIPWNKRTISENTDYFLKRYKRFKTKKKYILGFSFGAMIAMLAATKVRATGLILCSLSPYFREDITKEKKSSLSKTMKKRYKDFSTLHSKTLAQQVKVKQIHMLYGAKETKILIKRVKKAFRSLASQKKYLIPIKEVDHDIGHKKYLATIHQIAKTLR